MILFEFLPTRAEFDRARSTPRAYVVVDGLGLRWVPRPVTTPPRPVCATRDVAHNETCQCASCRASRAWKELVHLQAWAESEGPPTVRRWSSEAVADRVIADAYPYKRSCGAVGGQVCGYAPVEICPECKL